MSKVSYQSLKTILFSSLYYKSNFDIFLSFCFNASVLFLFLFLFLAPLFFLLAPHSLFYFRHVALLSSAQNIIFSPKCFCFNPRYFFSSAQKYYFHPKTFLLQPKILFQFSPIILFSAQNVFASAQDTFSVQPKNLSLFMV